MVFEKLPLAKDNEILQALEISKILFGVTFTQRGCRIFANMMHIRQSKTWEDCVLYPKCTKIASVFVIQNFPVLANTMRVHSLSNFIVP